VPPLPAYLCDRFYISLLGWYDNREYYIYFLKESEYD